MTSSARPHGAWPHILHKAKIEEREDIIYEFYESQRE